MNNNYNYPPQQNYQTYQAYSNYDNSYASQYPNYDYYYQQPNHQQQYYQPAIDPHSGRPSTYHIDQATSYAGHPPPLQETYDQNSLAQWNNYYAQYYPQQHYQRPPPVKPNKPLNPAADTRPMSKFCCNRVLKTVQAITQHESLHIKCPHCDFMCLKSYLEEHEEQYHGKPKSKKPSRPDGIAPPNAPKLDTPEKLAMWIAERKKNWPTPTNIERRTREEAEQMARGELPLKRKANIQHNQDKRQRIENNSVENKDDDDVMDPERDAVSSKNPSSMGKILLPEDRPKRRCMYFMKGKCTKGSECNFLHEKPSGPKVVSTIRKRPNLLYKLLEKEIMQEKSVILQCFRYIVDNNFFGKGEKANSQKSDTRDV